MYENVKSVSEYIDVKMLSEVIHRYSKIMIVTVWELKKVELNIQRYGAVQIKLIKFVCFCIEESKKLGRYIMEFICARVVNILEIW